MIKILLIILIVTAKINSNDLILNCEEKIQINTEFSKTNQYKKTLMDNYLLRIKNKIIRVHYKLKYKFSNLFLEEISNKNSNIFVDNRKIYILDENKKNRIIAHAGGMINSHIYTNSLEALNKHYEKGFKLFELDMLKTRDGMYVAVHSWNEWKEITKFKGEMPPTLKEFKKEKLYNKYTPLDMNDINKWFCEHDDAILISDKVNNPIEFSNLFLFKDRLYMELFSIDEVLNAVKHNIVAMPTWDILSVFGNKIVENLLELKIDKIAASRRIVDENKELLMKLKNNNIKVYAFHINYDKGKDEKYVICNELNYFYGIYADKWDFNPDFKCSESNHAIK